MHGKPFNIIKMPVPRPVETQLTIVDQRNPDNQGRSEIDIGAFSEGHSLSVGDEAL